MANPIQVIQRLDAIAIGIDTSQLYLYSIGDSFARQKNRGLEVVSLESKKRLPTCHVGFYVMDDPTKEIERPGVHSYLPLEVQLQQRYRKLVLLVPTFIDELRCLE